MDEVLKDLNALPTLISQSGNVVKPVSIPLSQTPPTIVSSSPSQIDDELEEMKTIFMNRNKSNNQNLNSSSSNRQQSSKKSKIDDELEELRNKYNP